ncbi:MAG: hypothetical protein GY772_01775 [bacterium]|nr:hypothetical protein [bacterium]
MSGAAGEPALAPAAVPPAAVAPAAAAAPAVSTVVVPERPAPASGAGQPYVVDPALYGSIVQAEKAGDIDVSSRNRLYGALDRAMKAHPKKEELLGKWAGAKRDRSGRMTLHFLREWIKDQSFGTLTLHEEDKLQEVERSSSARGWLTLGELVQRCGKQEAKERAKRACDRGLVAVDADGFERYNVLDTWQHSTESTRKRSRGYSVQVNMEGGDGTMGDFVAEAIDDDAVALLPAAALASSSASGLVPLPAPPAKADGKRGRAKAKPVPASGAAASPDAAAKKERKFDARSLGALIAKMEDAAKENTRLAELLQAKGEGAIYEGALATAFASRLEDMQAWRKSAGERIMGSSSEDLAALSVRGESLLKQAVADNKGARRRVV